MTTLWSGRFAGDPDRATFEFGRSLPFDRRLFEDDVTGSLAWAEALAGAGVITVEDHARLRATLDALLVRFRADPTLADAPDEDVHSLVERLLVEETGTADPGGALSARARRRTAARPRSPRRGPRRG